MCTYFSIFSKPWAVYVGGLFQFGHWGCGESWLAIKDFQPTTPVLKAGHLVSCSTLCVLCVVGCMLWRNVWIVEVRFLGFFLYTCFPCINECKIPFSSTPFLYYFFL